MNEIVKYQTKVIKNQIEVKFEYKALGLSLLNEK